MTPSADQIASHTLRDGETEITVVSVGASVQSWTLDRLPVVLGYADPADYATTPWAMGHLIGRVANRLTGARIEIDGQTYDLPANDDAQCIHGGPGGFGWSNWALTPIDDRSVRLTLISPDGDQGFPGEVRVEAILSLSDHTLTYDVTARVDRVTPINMAQHLYFNLMGQGDIRDHSLQLAAGRYTPNRKDNTPEGHVAPVAGTPYDFRTPLRLADADPQRRGHDASFVLDGAAGPAATVDAPNGLRLTLDTDRPCLQLFTAGGLGAHGTPGPGAAHAPFGGLCLEAQDYPDAFAKGFPSILHSPDRPYRQRTSIRIAPR